MNPTLCMVLPVRNDQRRLASRVCNLLDMLTDLRCPFEILLLDEGSTDATDEVACELAQQYPQVRRATRRKLPGSPGRVETALTHSTADYLLLHDGHSPLRPGDIRQAWHNRGEAEPDPRATPTGHKAKGAAFWNRPKAGANEAPISVVRRRAAEILGGRDEVKAARKPGQQFRADGPADEKSATSRRPAPARRRSLHRS